MKNEPNMYRVTYIVMVGTNYAGGYETRTTDVKELGDAERFKHIIKVEPIYVEIGEPIDNDIVKNAIKKRLDEKKMQAKHDKIRTLEEQLAIAKEKVYKI